MMRGVTCFAVLLSCSSVLQAAGQHPDKNRFFNSQNGGEPQFLTPQNGEENRFLTSQNGDDVEGKAGVTWKNTGSYNLITIPVSKSNTIAYNGTAAESVSILGTLGAIVGGLYFLAGFPYGGQSRSGSQGAGSRRFGPPPPLLRFKEIDHKSGSLPVRSGSHRLEKLPARAPQKKPVPPPRREVRKPFRPVSLSRPGSSDRSLFRPRPVSLRGPPPPNHRFRRPNPPRGAPNRRPVPAAAPQFRQTLAEPSTRPGAKVPQVSSFRNQENTVLPEPVQFSSGFQNDPSSGFQNDPFDEFRNSNFGGSSSFRQLIDDQFGDFTFEKLGRRSEQ